MANCLFLSSENAEGIGLVASYFDCYLLLALGTVNCTDWTGALPPGCAVGMPPAPIGRPVSGQLMRTATANGALSNFTDVNVMSRAKTEFTGSNQNLGMFINMDNSFNNQYEKWSIGLEPASGIQLPESPDIDLEKVMFNSWRYCRNICRTLALLVDIIVYAHHFRWHCIADVLMEAK